MLLFLPGSHWLYLFAPLSLKTSSTAPGPTYGPSDSLPVFLNSTHISTFYFLLYTWIIPTPALLLLHQGQFCLQRLFVYTKQGNSVRMATHSEIYFFFCPLLLSLNKAHQHFPIKSSLIANTVAFLSQLMVFQPLLCFTYVFAEGEVLSIKQSGSGHKRKHLNHGLFQRMRTGWLDSILSLSAFKLSRKCYLWWKARPGNVWY